MSANRSFFRNAFDRLIETRMRQAEREIARHRGEAAEHRAPAGRRTIG